MGVNSSNNLSEKEPIAPYRTDPFRVENHRAVARSHGIGRGFPAKMAGQCFLHYGGKQGGFSLLVPQPQQRPSPADRQQARHASHHHAYHQRNGHDPECERMVVVA